MKLLSFINYKIRDAYASYELRKQGIKPFNEYGLDLYSGCQGSGKTMSLVERLEQLRKEHPAVLIATNFGYIHEDFSIKFLEDIPKLAKYARENQYTGVLIGWDEIQNDFDNQTRTYPITILRTITQQRKQGIKILATSQVFTRVGKAIREQTFNVIECKTLLGRWTFQKWYKATEYEIYIQKSAELRQAKLPTNKKFSFIQTDEMRELYNSYAVIDNLESQNYDNFEQRIENNVRKNDNILQIDSKSII